MNDDRFNATILNAHAQLATQAWPLLEAGQPLPPDQLKAMGDFIGGANYWSTHQDEFVPVGYVRQGDSFVPIGGTQPPAGQAPWNYPVYMDTPMWGGERRTGVAGYPALNTRVVTSIPIRIPDQTYGSTLLKLSVAEYGTPACAKQVSFSRNPGDFLSYLSFGQGNTAEAQVDVGNQVQPGETIYFNVRFWSADLNAPGTDDASAGVSIGGAWPR